MSIEFKLGDLFDDKSEALVNTVNCVGVMGKGVAYEFKHRWPNNYKAYKKICDAKSFRPGQVFVYENGGLLQENGPRFIVNFPTKDHWRQKSKIEYISTGLDALVAEIDRLKIKSIALPPLGCGNGGLDWKIVCPLIIEKLSKLVGVNVFIYGPVVKGDNPEYVDTSLKMTFGRSVFLKAIAALETPFGGTLDRLSLQKIAYLLQAMGVKLNLEFGKNLYGPYSEALKKAIVALEDNYKLIAGFQEAREVHVTPAGYAAAEEFLQNYEGGEELIQKLIRLVDGFDSPYGLELLSTVHKVVTSSEAAYGADGAVKEILSLEKNKRNIFSENEIRLAFIRLKEDMLI